MNSETLADILAEMRDGRILIGCTEYVHDPHLMDLADRIEAAAAREREMAKGLYKKLDGNRAITGNAAAMREALTQVQIGFDGNVLGPIGDIPNDWEIAEAKRLCKVVDSALDAPPRNCDRFKAADEARMAFWDTHETIWDAFKNRGGTELFYEVLDWLFAPAEGGAK